MKGLNWYQNKVVSQVSFISAIVGVLTAIMAVMWNIRVTGEMAKKMDKIEQNQIQQLIINEKLMTIISMKE
jgi:hypothetical protein